MRKRWLTNPPQHSVSQGETTASDASDRVDPHDNRPRRRRRRAKLRERSWRSQKLLWESERVFLAWMRTSLSLVAVGFLLSRFDLFSLQGRFRADRITGIALVAIAGILAAFATRNFLITNKQIKSNGAPGPASPAFMLTLGVLITIFSGAMIALSLSQLPLALSFGQPTEHPPTATNATAAPSE